MSIRLFWHSDNLNILQVEQQHHQQEFFLLSAPYNISRLFGCLSLFSHSSHSISKALFVGTVASSPCCQATICGSSFPVLFLDFLGSLAFEATNLKGDDIGTGNNSSHAAKTSTNLKSTTLQLPNSKIWMLLILSEFFGIESVYNNCLHKLHHLLCPKSCICTKDDVCPAQTSDESNIDIDTKDALFVEFAGFSQELLQLLVKKIGCHIAMYGLPDIRSNTKVMTNQTALRSSKDSVATHLVQSERKIKGYPDKNKHLASQSMMTDVTASFDGKAFVPTPNQQSAIVDRIRKQRTPTSKGSEISSEISKPSKQLTATISPEKDRRLFRLNSVADLDTRSYPDLEDANFEFGDGSIVYHETSNVDSTFDQVFDDSIDFGSVASSVVSQSPPRHSIPSPQVLPVSRSGIEANRLRRGGVASAVEDDDVDGMPRQLPSHIAEQVARTTMNFVPQTTIASPSIGDHRHNTVVTPSTAPILPATPTFSRFLTYQKSPVSNKSAVAASSKMKSHQFTEVNSSSSRRYADSGDRENLPIVSPNDIMQTVRSQRFALSEMNSQTHQQTSDAINNADGDAWEASTHHKYPAAIMSDNSTGTGTVKSKADMLRSRSVKGKVLDVQDTHVKQLNASQLTTTSYRSSDIRVGKLTGISLEDLHSESSDRPLDNHAGAATIDAISAHSKYRKVALLRVRNFLLKEKHSNNSKESEKEIRRSRLRTVNMEATIARSRIDTLGLVGSGASHSGIRLYSPNSNTTQHVSTAPKTNSAKVSGVHANDRSNRSDIIFKEKIELINSQEAVIQSRHAAAERVREHRNKAAAEAKRLHDQKQYEKYMKRDKKLTAFADNHSTSPPASKLQHRASSVGPASRGVDSSRDEVMHPSRAIDDWHVKYLNPGQPYTNRQASPHGNYSRAALTAVGLEGLSDDDNDEDEDSLDDNRLKQQREEPGSGFAMGVNRSNNIASHRILGNIDESQYTEPRQNHPNLHTPTSHHDGLSAKESSRITSRSGSGSEPASVSRASRYDAVMSQVEEVESMIESMLSNSKSPIAKEPRAKKEVTSGHTGNAGTTMASVNHTQPTASPRSKPTLLLVSIVEARDIAVVLGGANPYVAVDWGARGHYLTAAMKSTCHPIFNNTFEFQLSDWRAGAQESNSLLKVVLFSRNESVSDECLGSASVDMGNILDKLYANRDVNCVIDVACRNGNHDHVGTIQISFQLEY